MRFVVALVLVGCGTDHHGVAADAAVDAPDYAPDASCRAQSFDYQGVFEDVATGTVSRGAMLVVRGDPTRHTMTTSTGSFVLCAPSAAPFVVDVDAPDDQLDGRIVVQEYDGESNSDFVPFTPAGLAAVLSGLGQTYDPSTGIVIAEQLTDSGDMSLSGSHGAALTNDVGWMTSARGRTVMFPNVPPGTPMLSRFADGFQVATEVFAGQITWVAVPIVQI
ncbi:MAG TPA: hypothetical protein VFQ65_00915 [Kofleriaceae bacterium]|nr:hypothetical protein [Kofleriaceae bacterium]